MDRSPQFLSAQQGLRAGFTRVDGLLDRPRYGVGLLLIVVAPLLGWHLATVPAPWFDEGYRLNMAQSLVQHGQYATQSVDGFRLFDPGTSTGPADIAVIALTMGLFGVGYGQARLAVTLFGLMGLVAMMVVARRWLSWRDSLLAVLITLVIPVPDDVRFLLLARQVMGEVPALSLSLLGAWLWFTSWERPGWGRPIGAGLLIGLGLLSKAQMLFGLGPALLIVSLLRAWTRPRAPWRELATGAVTLAVLLVWQALGYGLASEADRLANAETLAVMGTAQLFTGSWGVFVQPTGWWSVGLTATACVVTAASLAGRDLRAWREREWAGVFLSLSAAFLGVWYVLLSVGWVRYSFLASQFSLIVLAVHAVAWIARRGYALSGACTSLWRVGVIGVGLSLLVGGQVADLAQRARTSGLIEAQAYVRSALPATAVIETWEWELAAVIGQARTHTPDAAVLMEAVGRQTRGRLQQAIPYDALQADPDYLIVGQMAGWTGLYGPALAAGYFREIAVFGDYRIYERVR